MGYQHGNVRGKPNADAQMLCYEVREQVEKMSQTLKESYTESYFGAYMERRSLVIYQQALCVVMMITKAICIVI